MLADPGLPTEPGDVERQRPARMRPPATSLVGRDDELSALVARLRSSDVPLITITGRSGAGSTRLALEAMERVRPDLPGDAVVVELPGSVGRDTLLPPLATALGLPHVAGVTTQELVQRRLDELPTCVLLDDGGSSPDAVAWLMELLRSNGGRLLVTSRRPLGLTGEHLVRVPPLAVPDIAETATEVIAASPAVTLYRQRASAADHQARFDARNAQVIAELCRRLDGLPGAIELAAVRASVLPPRAFLAYLDRAPLEMPVRGSRAVASGAPRSLTPVRAALASSHDLSSDDAKVVLRRLAGFSGDVSIAGIEAVCAEPEWTSDRLLDAVGDLVDSHLVEIRHGWEPRFRLSSMVAVFAAECLEAAGERALVVERRGRWCAAAIRGEGDRLDPPMPIRGPSLADLQATLDGNLADGDDAAALRLAGDCCPSWSRVGWFPAAEAALRDLIDRVPAPDGIPSADLVRARVWWTRLDLDRPGIAAQGARLADELQTLVTDARASGDPSVLLLTLGVLVLSLPVTRDVPAVAGAIKEGLQLSELRGDVYWSTRFWYWSGMLTHLTGDGATAASMGSEGLRRALDTDDRRAIVPATLLIRNLEVEGFGAAPRTPTFEDVLLITREDGDPIAEGWVLGNLAHNAAYAGDMSAAVRWALETVRLGQRTGVWHGAAFGVAALVLVAIHRDELPVAARMLGSIERDLPAVRMTMGRRYGPWYEARIAEAREAAGADAWDQSLRAGAAVRPYPVFRDAVAWADRFAGAVASHERSAANASRPPVPEDLTAREREVLRCIARGDSNKDIGQTLGMSPKTVMHHSVSIYRKLGVRGRAEATAWAFRTGLVAID